VSLKIPTHPSKPHHRSYAALHTRHEYWYLCAQAAAMNFVREERCEEAHRFRASINNGG
jgi:hypothetical protein